eukprot:GHVP01038985.1.p1 GENE.GHVP01038985.1~~GHVP01038985.1.p1  ORF type:complete len:106 (-),score=10.67 GHVP01038985.1:854-1171(-)
MGLYPQWNIGWRAIYQMRSRNFLTERIRAMFSQKASGCKEPEPETLDHMLLVCSSWKGLRERMGRGGTEKFFAKVGNPMVDKEIRRRTQGIVELTEILPRITLIR